MRRSSCFLRRYRFEEMDAHRAKIRCVRWFFLSSFLFHPVLELESTLKLADNAPSPTSQI
jgi:hypothetical protein